MISGTISVACPACGVVQDCRLVQSINTRTDPDAVRQLLAGELDMLVCSCGKRTRLAARLLYSDPDARYLCQVCPGGEEAMTEGAAAFRATGATGTLRLVPSLDALVEKVRILDAGLDDRALEVAKVLLLAALGERDTERVLLFERLDEEVVVWVMFEVGRPGPQLLTTPREAYTRIAERLAANPPPAELRVDRVWAVEVVRGWTTHAS